MRQAVSDPQEAVGKRDPGDGRGMVHHLPGTDGSILVRLRQVLKEKLHRTSSMRLGEVVARNADIRLDGMDKSIHSSIRHQRLGQVVAEGAVHNGHVGSHTVAEERVLVGSLSDDSKGRDLTPSTAGSRDANKLVHLGSRVGEGAGSLAQLNEPRTHILQLRLGVLVKHSDTLGGIHRRPASKSNQHLRLELLARRCACSHALDRGIRSDIVKYRNLEANLLKHLLHLRAVPKLHHRSVRHNHGARVPLPTGVRLSKICDGLTGTVAIEVEIGRSLHPLHVLLTRCHQLDVDQRCRRHVGSNRRSSSSAHSQRQTGWDVEVERRPHRSNARWHVGKQVMCRHRCSKRRNPVLVVGMDHSSVSLSTKVDDGCAKVFGLVEGRRAIQSHHRAKLLKAEGLMRTDLRSFRRNHHCIGRDPDTTLLCNRLC
mmetsp:Transcript_12266/g.42744  ORF Transcript_12266/g.42744 Transcript_12266/m.42744 type:complete len:427 (+) Transcript_12266:600-1880(+)